MLLCRAAGAELAVLCSLQVNQKVSKTAHIKELNQEIDRLKAELFCTREKNGVYMPAELFAQREQVCQHVRELPDLPIVSACVRYLPCDACTALVRPAIVPKSACHADLVMFNAKEAASCLPGILAGELSSDDTCLTVKNIRRTLPH
jgi:hypothetical protein